MIRVATLREQCACAKGQGYSANRPYRFCCHTYILRKCTERHHGPGGCSSQWQKMMMQTCWAPTPNEKVLKIWLNRMLIAYEVQANPVMKQARTEFGESRLPISLLCIAADADGTVGGSPGSFLQQPSHKRTHHYENKSCTGNPSASSKY